MGSALAWAELWAFTLCLAAYGLAFFFGMMAWMAGAPLVAARRWLRWAFFPTAAWVALLLVRRFAA
jgi:hypothetical protein